MNKLTLIGSALLLTASSWAHSAEEGAGCGLGAEIMKGQSGKGANIAAAILNGLVIPNTFFMTTGNGMMGCDPTQTVDREELTEIFVAQNMDQISTDTAKGGGDHLTVLAALLGVQEGDVPHFATLAQSQFDQLFLDNNSAAYVIDSLQITMALDPTLETVAFN